MTVPTNLLVGVGAGLILVLAGAAVAYAGYREIEPELRRLRDDPLTVREATTADAPVELRGTVEPEEEETMTAPFTGTECVAYEFEVEEFESSGQSSHWESLADGSRAIPFRLADHTGSILVDPTGADLTLRSGWETEIGADETAQGRIREFLRALDVEPGEGGEFSVGPLSVGTGDRRRYSEERLDVGEAVSVFGRPEYDPDAGGEWGSDAVDAALRDREDAPFVVADAESVPILRRSTVVPGLVVAFGAAIAVAGLWTAVLAVLPG